MARSVVAFFLLALVLVASVVVAARLLLGYPQPTSPTARLSRGEVAFLNAVGDAFAPAVEGALARSGAEAELPAFTDEYLAALPERQRRLIRLMLVFFEQSTLLFPAPGRRGFARFSKLRSEQREALLGAWESSPLAMRRTMFTALKAFVIMGVVAHRDNLAHLGLTPWDIDSPVIESDLLYPPVGRARSEIAFDEDDVARVRNTSPLRPPRAAS
jgi:hypothetical protein